MQPADRQLNMDKAGKFWLSLLPSQPAILTFNSFYFIGYVQVAKGGQGTQERCHIGCTLEALGRRLDALAVINFQVDDGSVREKSQ